MADNDTAAFSLFDMRNGCVYRFRRRTTMPYNDAGGDDHQRSTRTTCVLVLRVSSSPCLLVVRILYLFPESIRM